MGRYQTLNFDISSANCNGELIFGKWTFFGMNSWSNFIISQIWKFVTSHFTTLYPWIKSKWQRWSKLERHYCLHWNCMVWVQFKSNPFILPEGCHIVYKAVIVALIYSTMITFIYWVPKLNCFKDPYIKSL